MPKIDIQDYAFLTRATQELVRIPQPSRTTARSAPPEMQGSVRIARTDVVEAVSKILQNLERLSDRLHESRSQEERRVTIAELLLGSLRFAFFLALSDSDVRPCLEWSDTPDRAASSVANRAEVLRTRVQALKMAYENGRTRRLAGEDVADGRELQELTLQTIAAVVKVIEGEGMKAHELKTSVHELYAAA